jgi:hypothetical protein
VYGCETWSLSLAEEYTLKVYVPELSTSRKFDEVFSGYQVRHVSIVWDDDPEGSRNAGSMQTPDTADSPGRLNRID